MYIYIIILLLIIFFRKKINTKKFNIVDILVLTVLILVSGLRYNIGSDYSMYKYMYFHPNVQFAEKVEQGFKSLINISYFIFKDKYYLFFILCSAITIICIYYIIKKYSKKPSESLFLFIALGIYTFSFNIVRQSIAMGVSLIGIKYIVEKKPIRYIITILLASTIHTTALLMLPIYLLADFNINKKKSIVLICFFSLLGNFLTNEYITTLVIRYFPQYTMYNNYLEVAGYGTYMNSIFYFIITFVGIYCKRKENVDKNNKENIRKNNLVYNVLIINTFFITFSLQNTLGARLTKYLLLIIILEMPEYLNVIKAQYRKQCKFIIFLGLLAYYIMYLYSFEGVYPYKSIFSIVP